MWYRPDLAIQLKMHDCIVTVPENLIIPSERLSSGYGVTVRLRCFFSLSAIGMGRNARQNRERKRFYAFRQF